MRLNADGVGQAGRGKGGAQLATIAIGGIGQHDAGRNSISQCGVDLN